MEVWFYDEATKKPTELLCKNDVIIGQGRPDVPFDEKNFIGIKTCLFSDDPSLGLEPMPILSDRTLYFKKVSNNTYGHTGDMSYTSVQWDYDPTTIPKDELEMLKEDDRKR